VHNIIRLKTDSAAGRLLIGLIDTAEFQRLRRIRQLGLAHFAYQAAEHSRFTHSLGALHLATRTLARLELNYKITDEDKTAVRCAALLHDIGHGAFSHVIEPIFGFHHETFTIEAVLSRETEVGAALREFSAELPEAVAAIIRGDFRPAALAQLVSSQLDVDRMDYLLRDSLMTGAKYGVYDLEWIIKSLEIDEENDRRAVFTRSKIICKRVIICSGRFIFTALCVRRKPFCARFSTALCSFFKAAKQSGLLKKRRSRKSCAAKN
jgi:HD superfamily phosphohydrolase